MKFITNSPSETKRIAQKALDILSKNKKRIILCQGNLGSGKTTFAQGLADILGVKERIKSPTFVLFKIYETKNKKYIFKKLYHADLYRLKSINNIGLEEAFENSNSLLIAEWPIKLKKYLKKKDYLLIKFRNRGERQRELELL